MNSIRILPKMFLRGKAANSSSDVQNHNSNISSSFATRGSVPTQGLFSQPSVTPKEALKLNSHQLTALLMRYPDVSLAEACVEHCFGEGSHVQP